MLDTYLVKGGKKLRKGYTTGSCATAAAKAASMMLHTQQPLAIIKIDTPAGISLSLKVWKPKVLEYEASCCIIKDSGDDPDITHGLEIFAHVQKRNDSKIIVRGGVGIGTITKPGFWGKVGDPAINPVPKKMITEALTSVDSCGWDVTISAPEAGKIHKRTFNANLGIIGGISILGTTGIVEPMSEEAWLKTIYLEIDLWLNRGHRELLLYLGNYGKQFIQSLELKIPAVKISNFIGEVLLYCYQKKLEKIVLVGHIGKLSKLSIGVFNTHSKVSDSRIEAFVYHLSLAGVPQKFLQTVSACTDTESAISLIFEEGHQDVLQQMAFSCNKRVKKYLKDESFPVEVIIYSMNQGIIGRANG